MASGYWGLRPKFTTISGAFWELLTSPNRVGTGLTLSASGAGSITQQLDGELWIYDDVALTYTPMKISDLPAGFRVTSISMYGGAAPFDFPNLIFDAGGPATDDAQVTSWSSSLSDFDSSNTVPANLTDVLAANEIVFNVSWNGVFPATPFIIARVVDASSYPGFPVPPVDANPITAFQTFYLFGEWDDGGGSGNTPGPLINPSVTATGNPGEYTVDLTPGPDTEIVEIQSPDGTVIGIYPVGVFPIVVILPGPTVVLTPINPNPSIVVGPPSVLTVIPRFDYVMSGGFDLGGSPTIQLLGNPSGIYTLVPNKTHDTLYERNAGSLTEQDVKIPDPFIKTAFVGD